MTRTALLAVSSAVLALSACEKKPDDAFGQQVRAYLLAHPELLQEMAVKLQEKERMAQATASKDAIQKFRAQIERDPRDVVVNPAGTITVVEFFDFNCGYCKLVAPEVVKLMQENPDVRLVFKQFAFQTDDSVAAAKIALTPAARANPLPLYANLMAQKPLNQATIDRSLKAAGIDPTAARMAANAPEIEKQIADAHTLARELKIDGTPAFVVGDQVIHGADVNALKAAIANARTGELKRPGAPT
jgi:protein-disulfide isomerase